MTAAEGKVALRDSSGRVVACVRCRVADATGVCVMVALHPASTVRWEISACGRCAGAIRCLWVPPALAMA